jgi:hypothetical protein
MVRIVKTIVQQCQLNVLTKDDVITVIRSSDQSDIAGAMARTTRIGVQEPSTKNAGYN